MFSSDEAKNGMLTLCVEIEVSVNELLGFLSETNSYWKKHDSSLGERWDTLSAVIKASQAVSALSSGLEKLMEEVKGKPSSDTVKTLSQEAATTAGDLLSTHSMISSTTHILSLTSYSPCYHSYSTVYI